MVQERRAVDPLVGARQRRHARTGSNAKAWRACRRSASRPGPRAAARGSSSHRARAAVGSRCRWHSGRSTRSRETTTSWPSREPSCRWLASSRVFRKVGGCVEGIVRRCRPNALARLAVLRPGCVEPSRQPLAPARAASASARWPRFFTWRCSARPAAALGGERPAATASASVTVRTIEAAAAAAPVETAAARAERAPRSPLPGPRCGFGAARHSAGSEKASARCTRSPLESSRPGTPRRATGRTRRRRDRRRPAGLRRPPRLAASEFDAGGRRARVPPC